MFDMVDHQVLIGHLKQHFSLSGSALARFAPYLTSRYQEISIAGASSESLPLISGIPQGSGLITFTIYMRPLGDIVHKYNLSFHIHANHTWLYLSFNNHDPSSEALAT